MRLTTEMLTTCWKKVKIMGGHSFIFFDHRERLLQLAAGLAVMDVLWMVKWLVLYKKIQVWEDLLALISFWIISEEKFFGKPCWMGVSCWAEYASTMTKQMTHWYGKWIIWFNFIVKWGDSARILLVCGATICLAPCGQHLFMFCLSPNCLPALIRKSVVGWIVPLLKGFYIFSAFWELRSLS